MLKINRKNTFSSLIFSAIIILLTAGCSNTAVKSENKINIQKVDSSIAAITIADLFKSDDKWILKGMANRRIPGRGPIYGHLQVSVINPHGELLNEYDINYMKNHNKSTMASYKTELPIDLMPGSTIKISHLTTRSH